MAELVNEFEAKFIKGLIPNPANIIVFKKEAAFKARFMDLTNFSGLIEKEHFRWFTDKKGPMKLKTVVLRYSELPNPYLNGLQLIFDDGKNSPLIASLSVTTGK